jgi:hypothetical protein
LPSCWWRCEQGIRHVKGCTSSRRGIGMDGKAALVELLHHAPRQSRPGCAPSRAQVGRPGWRLPQACIRQDNTRQRQTRQALGGPRVEHKLPL